MQRKYHVKPKIVMFLWFAVSIIVVVGLGTFFLTSIYDLFILRTLSSSKENIITDSIVISLSIVCWVVWKKVTFSYNDFLRLMKNNAVQFKMTQSPLLYFIRGYYLFEGILDKIYVSAIIDSPIAFNLNTKVVKYKRTTFSQIRAGGWRNIRDYMRVEKRKIPDYKEKESQVIFFIPFQVPRGADLLIESSAGIVNIVRSNLPEISNPLLEIFKEIDNFQGRAAFTDTGFCLTIIGGSWQGELFRKRIVSGIDLSKAVSKKFRDKYDVRSISKEDIVWDSAEEVFRLKSGDVLSVIENDSIKNNMDSPSIALK